MLSASQVPKPNSLPKKINHLVPVTIITGFLGSGKTTIIQNLLKQSNTKANKIVYIKNEVGDMDIDTKLVTGSQIVSQEILNGCVCCTLTGPLITAIDELINTYNPDRIIIETSGNAEPANMAITLGGADNIYRDGVISVIDTLNYNFIPEYTDHYQIQAKLTDLLVLNKIELVTEERKRQVISQLRSINSYSPIVEAANGILNPNIAYGASRQELNKLLKDHTHDHHGHKNLDTLYLDSDKPIDLNSFRDFCQNLPAEVIRLKGFVVADNVYVVNQVFKRMEIFIYDTTDFLTKTKLYAVGFNLKPHYESIKNAFARIKS